MQTLCPESGLRTAPNWPKIRKMTMTSQFSDMTSTSNFFDVVLFLLSSLVTGPSFMSISSLVLELWQFTFIRDWPEIRKLEIPPFEFCPLSGDYGKLGILNLVQTPLIKSHWMLQNARVTAFIVSEVFWNNHQRGKINLFVLKSTTIPLWWKSEIHLLQLIITHRQQWQHVINNHKTKFLKPR